MEGNYKGLTCGIVVDYILDSVANRALNTGDRLPPERELSQQLDVSRATVREAIKVLNYLGFIDSTQGSGNYVTEDYSRTITNILRVIYQRGDIGFEEFTNFRQTLELQALELAMEHSTEAQRHEMTQIVQLMDTTTDSELIITLDNRLHWLLVNASHNLLIMLNFNALSAITLQYMSDTFWSKVNKKSGGFQQLQSYHHKIVNSLIDRDLKGGRQAIIDHFAMLR